MFLRNWTRGVWASLGFALALTPPCTAADIRVEAPGSDLIQSLQASPGYHFIVPPRVLFINGEIRDEDVQTVEGILNDLRRELSFQEGRQFAAILDSPGGSFRAGIGISKLFKEFGVPTFVPPGASCLSACAVIFMSGNFRSMGGEGGAARARAIAVPAELGFHRPFLADFVTAITPNVLSALPPEEIATFFAEEYEVAFNVANQLIQDMLAVDPEAWDSDLLLKMLTATAKSGDEAFVRPETVQEALSWDIDIGQIRPPSLATADQKFDAAFALCFNHGPTVASSVDGFWPAKSALEREYRFNRDEVPRLYQNTRHATGRRIQIFVHHEAPMGCTVRFSEMTATVDVDGGPTKTFDLSSTRDRLWGHHPYTPLKSVAYASQTGQGYRCMVLNGNQTLDNDPCERQSTIRANGELVETFIWPSGGKTVVQSRGVQVRLNGHGTTSQPNLPAGMEACLISDETGRTFCYGAG